MSSVVSLSRQNLRRDSIGVVPDIIHRHDLRSVYQPILSPTHQMLVGYEALVRVGKGRDTMTPPALFELARQRNQLAELDRYLVHMHLDNYRAAGNPFWLFLNVNPYSCVHPGASLERLARHCRDCGVDPRQVVLELVETASDKPDALLGFIHNARTLGFQIAIDDFGTGHSNFERLWLIKPLIVKLDRCLLLNAEKDRRGRHMLESLVGMLQESGSLVLLEGVETADQARIALSAGADLVQGYAFGHPDEASPGARERAEARLRDTLARSRATPLHSSRKRAVH